MIQFQCKGPRGTVVGKPNKSERGARASALGTYSKTFGRDALKAAKGRLTFQKVRGNPAPSSAPSTSRKGSGGRGRSKSTGRSRKPPASAAPDLPFEVPIDALKEGKRLVLGLNARRRPVYLEQARTLTEARAMAGSGALPKAVKYRLVIEVSRHPGVYST